VKTGGWINEETIPYFVEYARFAFKTFGDRVKFWLTFNQLYTISYMGYGYGTYPPGVADPKESPWKVGHNVLRAHSQAYHAYVNEFKELQGGKVGLSLDMDWYDPTSDKKEDIDAAERGNRFRVRTEAHINPTLQSLCISMYLWVLHLLVWLVG
jgi:beta-glucosidase/6-phospho-beta-glucosidase/beta-galactosidase